MQKLKDEIIQRIAQSIVNRQIAAERMRPKHSKRENVVVSEFYEGDRVKVKDIDEEGEVVASMKFPVYHKKEE